MNGVSGRGVDVVKMGGESGANGSIGKVSFHHTELRLSDIFPLIKLNSLALYRLEFALMCLISVNVSDNTGILEIDDGIVDEELGGGGGMEDIEVIVFDSGAIEIGSGMCTRVEGNGELGITALASPYEMSINSNLPEGDVTCHLILPVLIEENKWVLPRITTVVLTPPTSWVVWIVELIRELGNVGNRTGCGREGDGRVVLSESDWFVTLYIVI